MIHSYLHTMTGQACTVCGRERNGGMLELRLTQQTFPVRLWFCEDCRSEVIERLQEPILIDLLNDPYC